MKVENLAAAASTCSRRGWRSALQRTLAARAAGDPAAQPARLRQLRLLPSCKNVRSSASTATSTMTYHRDEGRRSRTPAASDGRRTGSAALPLLPGGQPAARRMPGLRQEAQRSSAWARSGWRRSSTKKFPDLNFARVDSDTMHGARDYERLLGRFAQGKIQVLLGTQMIAKGLDFPNVTLVGVISGDTALRSPTSAPPSARSSSSPRSPAAPAAATSPAGSCCRRSCPTTRRSSAAIKQDYVGFATSELEHRREAGLPPFGRMVRIVFRDRTSVPSRRRREDAAIKLKQAAEQVPGVHIQGPMALRHRPHRRPLPQADGPHQRAPAACSRSSPPCARTAR